MRILVTADLHFNHPRSREEAKDLIARMNQAGGDVLLIVGDTAVTDGKDLEECLSLFQFAGPKLIVPGNHELWTRGEDSYRILKEDLPHRCREMGWHWLMDEPFRMGDIAIVGSVGWYDYSFARAELGIPKRFYERKVSPGVAAREAGYADLLSRTDDVSGQAMELFARWNDGVYVKLGRSDEAFLGELLELLEGQLREVADAKTVIGAVHCLPFAELLPPSHSAQWDFGKAYLGSGKIGELLATFLNVKRVYCGHSHFPARARVGAVDAINIGSGYRSKFYRVDDVPGGG
jgi:Icc-related predicted phosphoesterase